MLTLLSCVDALLAWLIRLAASRTKLRRFGPPGKGDPGRAARKIGPWFSVANWTTMMPIARLIELDLNSTARGRPDADAMRLIGSG
jgi:hypothetical protein